MSFFGLLISWVIYLLIGMMVGKWYWQRRHGVYKKVINGGTDAVFSSMTPISLVWPVLLLMPKFRDPELCSCPDHVMARAEVNSKADSYHQALREERGHRPIPEALSEVEGAGSLGSPVAAPPAAGVPAASRRFASTEHSPQSSGQRKAAADDPKVTLPDPGRPEKDLKQLGYQLFKACGLTYLTWGALPIEEHLQVVLQQIPGIRNATVNSIGGGTQGSQDNPDGMWMAYDGPQGSVLAYHVMQSSDFVLQDVAMRLPLIAEPVKWSISTVGAEVPAGVAQILAGARAVPLWELSAFAGQRFGADDLKVPASLASGLQSLGWSHIDNGDDGYKLDVPLNRGGTQAVFFTPYDAQSFAVVAPLDSSVNGAIPEALRGQTFRHYSLEVIADVIVLCERFPAGPPAPDPSAVTAAGRAVTHYAEQRFAGPPTEDHHSKYTAPPQQLTPPDLTQPEPPHPPNDATHQPVNLGEKPSRGAIYRDFATPDPGEILVRVVGEIAGEHAAATVAGEVDRIRRGDGSIVAADVYGLKTYKHSPLKSLSGLLAFEEISLLVWAEGGFGTLQKQSASREIKQMWRNQGLDAAVRWVLANAKHRPNLASLRGLLEKNASNPQGDIEAAFRHNLADRLRRAAKEGSDPNIIAAAPNEEKSARTFPAPKTEAFGAALIGGMESPGQARDRVSAPVIAPPEQGDAEGSYGPTRYQQGSAGYAIGSPSPMRRISRPLIIGVGGVVAVAGIAAVLSVVRPTDSPREEAPATRTATEAQPVTQPAAPATNVDPEVSSLAQLRQIADTDRPFVRAELADSWVPQVSSKRPGVFDDGVVWDNARTLKEFLENREKYDAKLLRSGDWSTFSAPDFWVTVVPVTFTDSDGALQWCTAHGFDSWHCLAKLVSTTHPVAGSTALN